MQMKIICCAFILIIGCVACKAPSKADINEKEIVSLYDKKGDSVLYVKRFMTNGNKHWVSSFRITDTLGVIVQEFTGKIVYADEDGLKKSKLQLTDDYDWLPENTEKVLFVQMQPQAFESEIDALSKRGPIEMAIDEQLKAIHSGEWIAGDIGPGGANMLFTVTDWKKGMDVIMKVLTKEKIETKTIIARRLIISDEDWTYEVIYPQQFTGYFNTF